MKKILIYLICLLICIAGVSLSQDQKVFAAGNEESINEDDLFSSEDMMVNEEEVVKEDVDDELKQKRIGFSGEITAKSSVTDYVFDYDWTGLGEKDQTKISNQILADFFCDIRIKDGIKGFLSLEAGYYPEGIPDETSITLDENSPPGLGDPGDTIDFATKKYTDLQIKEFFVDTNWNNKVYFRTGKQILKWGQGYFWNPTDLINVERKSFFDMDKTQEGTFGAKIQIPSGVKNNTYFFFGMEQANKTDEDKTIEEVKDLSLAGKFEFLVGNTEMSFSVLTRNDYKPVYGYDLTGSLWNMDIRGELSLSPGDNNMTMDYDSLDVVPGEDDWDSRAVIGFTKYFDHADIKNRISVTGEFYYNSAGYEKNIFQQIQDPGDKLSFMKTVYVPFMNSKYYMAFFSSVSKFMGPEITLNINSMMNLVDHSAVLTTGISYQPALTDLSIDLNLNTNLGDKNTEATFLGNRWSVSLGTKIIF